MEAAALATGRKEIEISTNSISGKVQARPQTAGAAITGTAEKHAAFLRKKSKTKGPKFSAYVSYVAIITLVLSIVSVGYQAPVEGEGSTTTASRAAIAAKNPSVDQLAAAQLAAVAANTADMAIASNVENLSISLSAKSEFAQADENLLSKPQIVQTGNSRGIKEYTAVAGDSVPSIAAANGVSPETIRWANGLTSDAIPAGKVLKIPSVSGVIYTVRPGDTAESLAQRYAADRNRIVTYNDAEIAGLQPGQQIVIPGGVLPETERPGYRAPSRSSGSSSNFVSAPRSTVFAGNRYSYGYCTWYAFNRRAELGRPIGSFWGNAITWASYARSEGFRVNNSPAPGAILQSGGYGGYGHVAVVESVDAEGNVTVSEMNYAGWNVVSTRTIPAGQASAYNYIH